MKMNADFKTAKRDASRNAILDAAEACARGGKPLQVGGVAEAAGIAVGTVYRYFDDKQQLEGELIARMLVSVVERIEQTDDPDADPAERLHALLHAICDAALEHLGALSMFLDRSTWSQLGTDHGMVGEAKSAYARYVAVEQDIFRLLKLKRIHNDTAMIFLRASVMAGLAKLAGANAAEQRKRIDEIIRLATRGFLGCVK